MRVVFCSAAALILFVGCRPAGTPGPEPMLTPSTGTLYREEIEAAMDRRTEMNAADLIRYLRPSFIKSRSISRRGSGERVVVDQQIMGDLTWLSSISGRGIESIQYLSSSDATILFGPYFDNGAIWIKTAP